MKLSSLVQHLHANHEPSTLRTRDRHSQCLASIVCVYSYLCAADVRIPYDDTADELNVVSIAVQVDIAFGNTPDLSGIVTTCIVVSIQSITIPQCFPWPSSTAPSLQFLHMV